MTNLPDTNYEILVELQPARGEVDVAFDVDRITEKSTKAIENAMKTIRAMAREITNTVKAIPLTERPHNVEIEFGLKLSSDANAVVVNAGLESQINVKLTWDRMAKEKKSTE